MFLLQLLLQKDYANRWKSEFYLSGRRGYLLTVQLASIRHWLDAKKGPVVGQLLFLLKLYQLRRASRASRQNNLALEEMRIQTCLPLRLTVRHATMHAGKFLMAHDTPHNCSRVVEVFDFS